MSPLLATRAGASARGYGWGITAGGGASAFELIGTISVGAGGVGLLEFSSIPQTYKHLQIRGIFRNSTATDTSFARVQFNGVTSASYSAHNLRGDGATASSGALANVTSVYIDPYVANNAPANVFGATVFDILDYTNTSKNTTVRALTGFDVNGSGITNMYSGAFYSTAAIASIQVTPVGGSFMQYTTISLYGVK